MEAAGGPGDAVASCSRSRLPEPACTNACALQYPAGALAAALYITGGIRGMERGTLSEQREPDGSEVGARGGAGAGLGSAAQTAVLKWTLADARMLHCSIPSTQCMLTVLQCMLCFLKVELQF